MLSRDKHRLWDKDLSYAKYIFSCYYYQGALSNYEFKDENLLDDYLECEGKKSARKVASELHEIIESDMDDDEIGRFIENKLKSEYSAKPGESRQWLIEIRDRLQQKSRHFGRNRKVEHALWSENMEEAKVIFKDYHSPVCDKVGDDDYELLDLYLAECGNKKAQKAVEELTKIIESDMGDEEIEDYIYDKLKSEHYAEKGKSRNWLIRIRDYLKGKV